MLGFNRAWHAAHRMPKSPRLPVDIAWHGEQAAACGCRAMPRWLMAELKAQRGS